VRIAIYQPIIRNREGVMLWSVKGDCADIALRIEDGSPYVIGVRNNRLTFLSSSASPQLTESIESLPMWWCVLSEAYGKYMPAHGSETFFHRTKDHAGLQHISLHYSEAMITCRIVLPGEEFRFFLQLMQSCITSSRTPLHYVLEIPICGFDTGEEFLSGVSYMESGKGIFDYMVGGMEGT
jgi:hypothetical protein